MSAGAFPLRSGRLAIACRDEGDAYVIAVQGELDVATAPSLAGELSTAVQQGGDAVIVDLSGTLFVDSTGLAVLLNALRRLTRQRRGLALVCREGGPVHRMLAMTKLLGTFSVHRSLASALGTGRPERLSA